MTLRDRWREILLKFPGEQYVDRQKALDHALDLLFDALPEPMIVSHTDKQSKGIVEGWNACLARIKEG